MLKSSLAVAAVCAAFAMPQVGYACARSDAKPITAKNTYDVFRNGDKIGRHTITFEKSGDRLDVTSKTFMQVKVLFVSAFKYEYDSQEHWCGGAMQSVYTKTNNNGKDILTEGSVDGDQFRMNVSKEGVESQSVSPVPLFPTNHWNKVVLKQEALFDTIKGSLFDITVKPNNAELHPDLDQDRYDVSGTYDYVTYYDKAGHWQGMAFQRGEKNFIEFKCRDCTNTILPN